MPDQDKVTINEAARRAGVHPNTIRNWRDGGRLDSAEKIIEGKNETWYVDLEEIETLKKRQKQNRSKLDNNNDNPSSEPFSYQQTEQGDNGRLEQGPGATTYLMSLKDERDSLQTKIYDLQDQLKDASFERGRMESLERQIDRL